MNQRIACAILSTLLAASCSTEQSDQVVSEESRYEVDIRWTSYGIPHVKADNWAVSVTASPMRP